MAFKHRLGLIAVTFCALAIISTIISLSSRHWTTCTAKDCPSTVTTNFGLFAYYSCYSCCNGTLPAPGVCGEGCYTYYWADPATSDYNPHGRQASRVASALLITGIAVSLLCIVGGVLRSYEKEALFLKRKVQFISNISSSTLFLACVLAAPLFYSIVFPTTGCFFHFSWFLNFFSAFLLVLSAITFIADFVFNRESYGTM